MSCNISLQRYLSLFERLMPTQCTHQYIFNIEVGEILQGRGKKAPPTKLSSKCTRYYHLNPSDLKRKALVSPNNVESSIHFIWWETRYSQETGTYQDILVLTQDLSLSQEWFGLSWYSNNSSNGALVYCNLLKFKISSFTMKNGWDLCNRIPLLFQKLNQFLYIPLNWLLRKSCGVSAEKMNEGAYKVSGFAPCSKKK